MRKMALVGLVVALVLFVLASLDLSKYFTSSSILKLETPNIEKKDNVKVLEQKIKDLTLVYQQRNQLLLQEFEKSIDTVGLYEFQTAQKNVSTTVENLTGYWVTAKLCYKMAKDKIMSSQDTAEALQEIIVPNIIVPCEDGNNKLQNALNVFLLHLQENSNQYQAELALNLQNSNFPAENSKARNEFLNNNKKFIAKTQSLVFSKVAISLGVVVDAVFIKSTIQTLRVVCNSIVGKLVGSATTATISAVADGPLPIGDVIGATVFAGGAIWCGYDIYNVSKIIPKELETILSQAVSTYHRDAKADVLKSARQAFKEYSRTFDKIANEL